MRKNAKNILLNTPISIFTPNSFVFADTRTSIYTKYDLDVTQLIINIMVNTSKDTNAFSDGLCMWMDDDYMSLRFYR